jgi:hypothetical protein
VLLRVAAFFYPDPNEASALGGSEIESTKRAVALLGRSIMNAVF